MRAGAGSKTSTIVPRRPQTNQNGRRRIITGSQIELDESFNATTAA